MLRIYFVRHGETVWNTKKIFQGKLNSPLTELGVEQAKKLSIYLKDIHLDKVYSSPLQRALDTTNLIIKNRDLPINLIEEFKEINMGEVAGIPKDDFENNFPEAYFNFWNNPIEYDPSPFKGENYSDLLTRVERGLNKLIENNENKTILVVSHGVTLKAIFNIINNKGIDEFSKQEVPANTSTTIVEYNNGKFEIINFSDTTHLS